jgi:hypothetical protein
VGVRTDILTGFVPGFPRLDNDTMAPYSVGVEVLLYRDTRSKFPNLACHAIPRGALPTHPHHL